MFHQLNFKCAYVDLRLWYCECLVFTFAFTLWLWITWIYSISFLIEKGKIFSTSSVFFSFSLALSVFLLFAFFFPFFLSFFLLLFLLFLFFSFLEVCVVLPLKADWLWQEDPSVTGQTTCLRSKTLPDAEWRSVIRRPLLSNNPPPLFLPPPLPPPPLPPPPLPPPKRQPPTPPTSSAHLLRLPSPPLYFRCGNETRSLPTAHSWKHFPLASVRLL